MFINDSTYNKINNDYLGYIEYLDIKVEIILGINQKNLDNHHVCLDYESTSLDNNVNKILAGHNIDDVFKKLHIQIMTKFPNSNVSVSDLGLWETTRVRRVKNPFFLETKFQL